MRTIHKYPFEVNSVVKIRMPQGAEVLTVQIQGDQACLWALVDPDARVIGYNFVIFGTGHPVPEGFTKDDHVATFQTLGGSLVWHIFRST